MTESSDIADRKELARKMAMQRTKPNLRKKLSEGKEEGDSTSKYAARKGNMLCFTGEEANGL